MKKSEFVVIFCLIGLAILFLVTIPGSDHRRITTRMKAHSEKVIDIDRCYVRQGPYWLGGKNYRIYQVITDEGEYWVRFGGWTGPDIEKKTETGYHEETW